MVGVVGSNPIAPTNLRSAMADGWQVLAVVRGRCQKQFPGVDEHRTNHHPADQAVHNVCR